jgi:hypothetical protein
MGGGIWEPKIEDFKALLLEDLEEWWVANSKHDVPATGWYPYWTVNHAVSDETCSTAGTHGLRLTCPPCNFAKVVSMSIGMCRAFHEVIAGEIETMKERGDLPAHAPIRLCVPVPIVIRSCPHPTSFICACVLAHAYTFVPAPPLICPCPHPPCSSAHACCHSSMPMPLICSCIRLCQRATSPLFVHACAHCCCLYYLSHTQLAYKH